MLRFWTNWRGFLGVTEIICFPYIPPERSPSCQIARSLPGGCPCARSAEQPGVRQPFDIRQVAQTFEPEFGVIVDSSRNPTLRTLRSGAGSLSQPVSLGGFGSGLAEQASWNVDQRESSSLLWQFVGVGLHDYLDSFVAGVDFDPHGLSSKSTSCRRPDLPRMMAWDICAPAGC
jgi:hypothetical protein